MNYYNENDPKAAAWLRELIGCGHLPLGVVDERSILDVHPADLEEFTACHFFAGIGGWAYALRLADWPDDRPVWTGSCPCQPFSAAGAGRGFADERHLWPAWFHLLSELRPPIVFGEQVASPAGYRWLDLVYDDLEGVGYAVGPVVLPAASVQAPHERHRLWFVADTQSPERRPELDSDRDASWREGSGGRSGPRDVADPAIRGQRIDRRASGNAGHVNERESLGMGHADEPGSQGRGECRDCADEWVARSGGVDGSVGDAESGAGQVPVHLRGSHEDRAESGGTSGSRSVGQSNRERETTERRFSGRPIAERERSPWAEAEWIPCRDGTVRPVEPGTFPLAHGVPARVGRLRGYGNAIVPQVAAEVIGAYMDVRGLR